MFCLHYFHLFHLFTAYLGKTLDQVLMGFLLLWFYGLEAYCPFSQVDSPSVFPGSCVSVFDQTQILSVWQDCRWSLVLYQEH